MRENRVKKALKEGKVVIGTMVSEVRSPGIAQMLATAGFDFMVIDLEHSGFSIQTMADLILGARAAGITSIVRVPSKKGHHLLSRPLDVGAQGLLVPQVETKEEVVEIIKATKYYPLGQRGMALRRIHSDFVRKDALEITRSANEQTLIILQIESKKAIDGLDELLSVEGVDAALIGPNDLSQSLGIPGQTTHPKEIEYIGKMVNICKEHNVPSGIHLGSVEALKKWINEGMRLIMVSSDINMIVETAARLVRELREVAKNIKEGEVV